MEVKLTTDFVDKLIIEGINYKGFGVLPKYVMIDPDLTIEAKAIYAYFCSYAGNGNTAFPTWQKIVYDLQINKDTYYKHLKILTEQGYLTIYQKHCKGGKGNGFYRNIYTLVSNPKKFSEKPENNNLSLTYSRIQFSGLKSSGFGMIPKAIMIDTRLKIKAKAIYAYFCSFTGSGDSAFPTRNNILFHLHIGSQAYYKYYNELIRLNYISVVQRQINGKMSVNDYYLNDNPDINKALTKSATAPCSDSSEAQIPEAQIPEAQIPEAQIPEAQIPEAQIPEAQISEANINSLNKNSSYNNQSINQQTVKRPLPAPPEIDGLKETEKESIVLQEILKENTIPLWFITDHNRTTIAVHIMTEWGRMYPSGYKDKLRQSIYNLFNEALIEMCCTQKPMVLKNYHVTSANVLEKINLMARFENGYIDISAFMETALNDYYRATETTTIGIPISYMKSCIWNAMQTGLVSTYSDLNYDGYM